MPFKIISETITNNPIGEQKNVFVQFIGEKLSFIDYISGSIVASIGFIQMSEEEKEKELLRIIKKEFFPEPFNEDKIDTIAQTVADSNVKFEENIVAMESLKTELNVTVNALAANLEKVSKQVLKSDISEEDYQEIISIYPEWKTETVYAIGNVVRFENKAWEVIQAHTSQIGWEPKEVPALFKEITPKTVITDDGEVGIIPEFVQPTGAHDAYKIGDKVSFNGKIYVSKVDANTYSPTDYAQNWQEQV